MSREHRGMRVVEPKISKGESDRRKRALKKRVLSVSNKSHFKTKLLLAVSSLIHDVTEMWVAGIKPIDVLRVLGYAVNDVLAKEGYKGKIEFPFGIPFPVNPIYSKQEVRRRKAHEALVRKIKAGVVMCLGKTRGRCPNPKCRKEELFRWPESFGKSHLLCSSCGWTDQKGEV
jgi:hypothetical protein